MMISSTPIPFTNMVLTTAQISNYIQYKVWDRITYELPTFNGAAVGGCEWISNFIPHFIDAGIKDKSCW